MLHFAGQERKLAENNFIVSKTNLKGHIVYANDVFFKISDFTLKDVLNKPHSIIRHESMPRCIFQLLWERLQSGNEIFAYVVNRTRGEDYYWVLAHVTPSRDENGDISSYHSNRRRPTEKAVEAIKSLYDLLLQEEAHQSNRKKGQEAGYALLMKILDEKGLDYDQFVLSL